jgi:hypothetical protein
MFFTSALPGVEIHVLGPSFSEDVIVLERAGRRVAGLAENDPIGH